MAAGLLLRCAAGMEDRRAFVCRETGQFQFLERRRRHGGNLRPMFNGLRREFARGANLLVGGVVLELQREQFQRERIEFRFGVAPAHGVVLGGRQLRPQARGKLRKFCVHAVLVHGWCSATAGRHDNTPRFRRK